MTGKYRLGDIYFNFFTYNSSGRRCNVITKVMIIEVVSITFLGEDKRMKEENIMKMASDENRPGDFS